MNLANLKHAAELRLHQSLSPKGIARVRDRRLARMVAWAAENVPWYRRLLADSGVHPSEVRTMADLRRLPVTRREHVQGTSDLVAEGIDSSECVVRHTGGSTGRPLPILTRRADLEYEALVWLRTWFRLGLRATDVQATIKDPEDQLRSAERTWFQRIGLLRVEYLDIYRPAHELLDDLGRIAPDVLRAPPSMLEAITREMESRRRRGGWTPRVVFTTSEQLNRRSREVLQDRFAAPVHECYGATEAGCIAWRCPRCGRYHLNSDTVIVEVLDSAGRPVADGEVGEIVVTNLFSKAMPFLRYGLGDVGRVDRSAACRLSNEPLAIRDLLGRTVDRLVTPTGGIVSPYQFMPDEIEGIVEYQIVQDQPGNIRILVVPSPSFRPEKLAAACREYEEDLEHRCRVAFETVETIPTEPGQEFRRVVSRVADQGR
jgi:phenylacetate-CoA ligase